jgi:uncharacterized protein involved in response to NO
MSDTQKSSQPQTWVAFATGFRLFFLGAAGLAGLAIAYWGVRFFAELQHFSLQYYPTIIWHMHEMVFGYIGAVIAGFLLTAVTNWTGLPTLRGWPLALLFLIWLSARCLPFLGDASGWLTASLNLLFFIYLAVAIAIPIVRSGNKRNLFVVAIILALAMTNAVVHAELQGYTNIGLKAALSIAFYLELCLTVIIAGRVFPMFSAGGLKGIYSPQKYQWLEIASLLSFVGFAVLNVVPDLNVQVAPIVLLLGGLITAGLHALRVAAWFHWRIFSVPLVWVLHLGYYFLIAGIVLIGLSGYYPETKSSGLHAMLAGGLGLITVGMMARVSLGHTGRNIHKPHKLISVVFILIAVAAFVRVFMPLISNQYYLAAIKSSSVLWGSGFGLFIVLYASVLLLPRVDGELG